MVSATPSCGRPMAGCASAVAAGGRAGGRLRTCAAAGVAITTINDISGTSRTTRIGTSQPGFCPPEREPGPRGATNAGVRMVTAITRTHPRPRRRGRVVAPAEERPRFPGEAPFQETR